MGLLIRIYHVFETPFVQVGTTLRICRVITFVGDFPGDGMHFFLSKETRSRVFLTCYRLGEAFLAAAVAFCCRDKAVILRMSAML